MGENPMSTRPEILKRNLRELEKREAMYGPGQAPIFLLNQIAELRGQIAAAKGEPPESPGPPTPPGPRLPDRGRSDIEPFVLQLFRPRDDGPPYVQVQSSSAGNTGPREIELPYSAEELPVVLKALATPFGGFPKDKFNQEEKETLVKLGLATGEHLLHTMYDTVGRRLYRSMFPRQVENLFSTARAETARERVSLPFRLVFDENAPELAAYPWELIHDDVPLVADGVVDLTRYVVFPRPSTVLDVKLPLRVLVIPARPGNLSTLPGHAEPDAILEGLRPLKEQGALEVTLLSPPTRDALVKHFDDEKEEVHIVHFDGHGSFGRLCPVCHVLHTATSKKCVKCSYPLSSVEAQGYLAFENDVGEAHYVGAKGFANSLTGNKTQLVVLSACRSGQVGGGSIFGGVGPALIRAGVPAVVAMQLTVPVDQAVRFAGTFYASLADFQLLVEAVGRCRRQLYDETSNPQAWFVPTLYLRSEDPRGELLRHPV